MESGYTTGTKRPMNGGPPADASSKRQRTTESRVVFVRGLPSDCLESELLALCCPFAVVEKSLLIPQKSQAFVQLPDVTSATNLINFYQTRDAMIRGKKIFFEYSSRDEITTRDGHEPRDQPSQQASVSHPTPQPSYGQPAAAQMATPQHAYIPANGAPVAMPHHQAAEQTSNRRAGSPNTILMVTVTKIEYDVTVDVLQQVFQKFGNVQKIVTFWKNEEFKALIQMESVDQAQAAQSALDGRDIYTGCNTLHIVFSRHTELRVRFNDDRSRDYTNPNLPSGPGAGESGPPDTNYEHEPVDHYAQPPYQQAPPQSQPPMYQQGPPVYDRDEYRPDSRGSGPPPGYDYPPDNRDPRAHQLPPHSTGRSLRGDIKRSPVLICSNMDSRLVNPDRLFTFFGCFGDVVRVKIMFRKQDTALIQFVDEPHATSALDHLDGVHVFGKKLRVDYSKHTNVSMPRGEVDRFELENTRDFSSSPLHRYRRRSPAEAVSPCPLLHISGIPMELQRNQNALIDLFTQYGYVKNFHYIQKNTKMAIVEMGSMDEAIMALLYLDNLTYPDSHMRVSFSKAFQLGQQPPSGPGGHQMSMPPPHMDPYPSGGNGYPRDRSRDRGDRGRDRDYPPMGRGRDRSRDRSRDRGGYRDRDRGGNRGGDRGSYRRPPPGRY
ncbi:hypothetical protein Poli38472_004206 [Pythium oligandrum]|uniref:RRM domain-containing protein n=1 Tax=Pythium oligandrum TaxID=41045 RepID=A0A8K1CMN4_PYTOL|nr:hypothetical protein Poli38472_004206 [Pythium oligandrum]|eukprot:TMW66441.1 hypothetical protein Poli38472_004206 [Pythium oligandrum]